MTPPTFKIFLGDAKTMYLKAVTYDCFGQDPLDLTSCTEIDIALPNQDGTFVHLLLTEEDVSIPAPALLGKFEAPISAEVSALLNVGEFQNVVVTFTISGEKFSVSFMGALSVYER